MTKKCKKISRTQDSLQIVALFQPKFLDSTPGKKRGQFSIMSTWFINAPLRNDQKPFHEIFPCKT